MNPPLVDQIIESIDRLVEQAEVQTRPLELEPFRSRLFELFVTADGAGYTRPTSLPDLTADGVCRALAARWGLRHAAEGLLQGQQSLSPQHMAKMRLLWSVMRMWMEWTYAWQRWSEFHQGAALKGGEIDTNASAVREFGSPAQVAEELEATESARNVSEYDDAEEDSLGEVTEQDIRDDLGEDDDIEDDDIDDDDNDGDDDDDRPTPAR